MALIHTQTRTTHYSYLAIALRKTSHEISKKPRIIHKIKTGLRSSAVFSEEKAKEQLAVKFSQEKRDFADTRRSRVQIPPKPQFSSCIER